MTLLDRIQLPLANLLRIKIRSILTISGVMIAIGSLVTLLSFGAGNQKWVTDQFNELGLFSTMHVYPVYQDETSDTTTAAILNDSVLTWLTGLEGVELAFPYDDYDVTVIVGDTTVKSEAQTIPVAAAQTKLFSRFEAGRMYGSDSAREVIVTSRFLDDLGIDTAESIINDTLILSVERASLDSGFVTALRNSRDIPERVFVDGWIDSLRQPEYVNQLVRVEASQVLASFAQGFFESPNVVTDTLVIVGVLNAARGRSGGEPLLIPLATARKFDAGGMSNDPTELFAMVSRGGQATFSPTGSVKTYPRVTLQLDPHIPYGPLADTIKAHGLRTFSYAEEFEEIQRFFLYFDMGLALIGLIALVTASLGIVNTMIMAILERRREIGVLKSLGASENDIRMLFLFETGLIGLIGALGGLLLGWLVSRLFSAIAQTVMENEGIDPIDLFTLPWWLVGLAILFGLAVSVAAGAYPASRAARVDPMEALRVE